MDVEIIEPDKVKLEKVKDRLRIENIASYEGAISKTIPWIKENIYASPDKKIRIRTKDIAKVMGEDFKKKKDIQIYWGLKYILFLDGIVVERGRTIPEGEHLLIMRMATTDDVLPAPFMVE